MLLRIKDLNIKSLQTGDIQAWIKLETTSPDQIQVIKELAGTQFVQVAFENGEEK